MGEVNSGFDAEIYLNFFNKNAWSEEQAVASPCKSWDGATYLIIRSPAVRRWGIDSLDYAVGAHYTTSA